MPFNVGKDYTREDIHAQLRGETQSFLPQHKGRIVCGCFTTESNPDAPRVVLVGGSSDEGTILKKAKLLVGQGGTLPIFLKKAPNEWTYSGNFSLIGYSEDADEIGEYQERAGRTKVAMVLFFGLAPSISPAPINRKTYLLTWNPKEFPWDDIEADAQQVIDGQKEPFTWSCGNTKRIQVGDRLFLLRQGVEPRGIVASGWATSEPYEEPHWDSERAERGVTATYIEVRFERILVPTLDDPLPLAVLKNGELATVNWSTQRSGIEIKVGVAELERLWKRHLEFYDLDNGDGLSAIEGEVTLTLRRHRARERWLRDAKLADYKLKNNGRLPCEACGFDFLAVYGEVGRDYAQVHHLKPLGDRTRPSLTRLDDLAVVCANCHAMVHCGKDDLTLSKMLREKNSLS